MENRSNIELFMLKSRRIKLLFIIFLLFFGLGVFSYDNLIIHPSLSRGAGEIYNSQAEEKLTEEQVNWIIEGSIAEDIDPRYLNHYYEPTIGRGLYIKGTNIEVGLPTKTWAKNQSSVSGDYSESAIFNNYKDGNYKRAYQGVGHILHLIQDMAVPAHTRNDEHAMGDPYEKWAQQYGNVNLSRVNYIYVNNLDQVFEELASYSNANFYSEDTIINVNYENIKIEKDLGGKDAEYLFRNGFKILQMREYRDGIDYSFDFRVHLDYWNMLYPKAVGYSAGAIDYFVREFKKIDEAKAKEQADLSFWDKVNNALGDFLDNTKYVWGDTFLAGRVAASDVWDFTKETARTTQTGAKYFTQANVEILQDTAGRVLAGYEGLTLQDVLGVKAADTADEKPSSEDSGDRKLSSGYPELSFDEVGVERVIDGDTIVLTSGETVRYIGVDTPELNSPGADDDECLAWAARLRNMALLARGDLELVKDPGGDKDKYGRLLRYVYVGGVFVNEVLAREGLAKDFFCQPGWENCPVMTDSNKKNLILFASKEAQENERGIYSDVCLEKEVAEKENAEELSSEASELSSSKDKEDEKEEDWLVIFGAKDNPNEESLEAGDEQTEENAEEEIAPEPEIIPAITLFNIISLTSSSAAYTASATVEIDYEIQNQDLVDGYYLSEDSNPPAADNPDWATSTPADFILSDSEGEKIIYFWLRYNENQISVDTNASIILDTTAPTPPAISSIAPFENVYWVNDSQVNLSGSKENSVDKIFINNIEYSATTSDETWQADIDINFVCPQTDLGERMSCIQAYCLPDMEVCGGMANIESVQEIIHVRNLTFKSQDEAGNLSEEVSCEFKIDFGPPGIGVFMGLKSLARRKLYMGVMAADPPAGGGFALASGIVGYEWQYLLNGGEDWLDAGSLSAIEIDDVTAYSFSGEANSNYIFQVRAIDKAGNYSIWSSEIFETPKTVSVSFPLAYPVISEIYGGGGNSDSYWKNDFIELYNPNDFAISLDGWSVQYAAAASATTTSASWKVTSLTGSIGAYGYYLIKENHGDDEEEKVDLPEADVDTGEEGINLNATAGKVALVNNAEAITGQADENVVDFVGYGTTTNEWEGDVEWANQRALVPPYSKRNTASIERLTFLDSDATKLGAGGEHATGGNGWDSNRNSEDFVVRDTPEPQNSAETEVPVN